MFKFVALLQLVVGASWWGVVLVVGCGVWFVGLCGLAAYC